MGTIRFVHKQTVPCVRMPFACWKGSRELQLSTYFPYFATFGSSNPLIQPFERLTV